MYTMTKKERAIHRQKQLESFARDYMHENNSSDELFDTMCIFFPEIDRMDIAQTILYIQNEKAGYTTEN